MTNIALIFSKQNGTKLRNVLRAVLLIATAFGFKLSGQQIGTIMLAVEGVLGLGTATPIGDTPVE